MAKNYVGYISKSKSGNAVVLKVEQDMVLKSGDALILQTPSEVLDSKVAAGFIEEDYAEQLKEKIPSWKLYEVSKMKNRE